MVIGSFFQNIAVVHQQHIGALPGCIINGGAAGGDGGDDFGHFIAPFHLQAVGGVILKQAGLQRVVAPVENVAACGHACPFFGC
jgi:hypothetical protein